MSWRAHWPRFSLSWNILPSIIKMKTLSAPSSSKFLYWNQDKPIPLLPTKGRLLKKVLWHYSPDFVKGSMKMTAVSVSSDQAAARNNRKKCQESTHWMKWHTEVHSTMHYRCDVSDIFLSKCSIQQIKHGVHISTSVNESRQWTQQGWKWCVSCFTVICSDSHMSDDGGSCTCVKGKGKAT